MTLWIELNIKLKKNHFLDELTNDKAKEILPGYVITRTQSFL